MDELACPLSQTTMAYFAYCSASVIQVCSWNLLLGVGQDPVILLLGLGLIWHHFGSHAIDHLNLFLWPLGQTLPLETSGTKSLPLYHGGSHGGQWVLNSGIS